MKEVDRLLNNIKEVDHLLNRVPDLIEEGGWSTVNIKPLKDAISQIADQNINLLKEAISKIADKIDEIEKSKPSMVRR